MELSHCFLITSSCLELLPKEFFSPRQWLTARSCLLSSLTSQPRIKITNFLGKVQLREILIQFSERSEKQRKEASRARGVCFQWGEFYLANGCGRFLGKEMMRWRSFIINLIARVPQLNGGKVLLFWLGERGVLVETRRVRNAVYCFTLAHGGTFCRRLAEAREGRNYVLINYKSIARRLIKK